MWGWACSAASGPVSLAGSSLLGPSEALGGEGSRGIPLRSRGPPHQAQPQPCLTGQVSAALAVELEGTSERSWPNPIYIRKLSPGQLDDFAGGPESLEELGMNPAS